MVENAEQRKRRKAYMYATRLGLSKAERLELAEALLWRDVESWQALDEQQLDRLLDGLEGYALINHLLITRSPATPRPPVGIERCLADSQFADAFRSHIASRQ